MHDVFSGHIADARPTASTGSLHLLSQPNARASCNGTTCTYYLFRPPLANELRRRLRLRASTEPLTFREWGELLLVAICVVWYNPEFFPPAQTAREFRALTLALPTDGSEDTQAKVLLLSQEIDLRLLQPMTLHRLAELRKEIKA